MPIVLLFGWAPIDGSLAAAQNEPGSYKPDEIQIDLWRSQCFGGRCPAYSVEISGEGTVKFRGIESVAAIGQREARISQSEVVNLVNDFLRARVFEAPDSYTSVEAVSIDQGRFILGRLPTPPSDFGPSTTLQLRLGSRAKRVSLDGFVPDEVRHIAMRIDAIPQIKDWIGRKE